MRDTWKLLLFRRREKGTPASAALVFDRNRRQYRLLEKRPDGRPNWSQDFVVDESELAEASALLKERRAPSDTAEPRKASPRLRRGSTLSHRTKEAYSPMPFPRPPTPAKTNLVSPAHRSSASPSLSTPLSTSMCFATPRESTPTTQLRGGKRVADGEATPKAPPRRACRQCFPTVSSSAPAACESCSENC